MDTSTKTTDVLNDLIQINNDRIAGFEKASNGLDSSDMDLKTTFDKLAGDSRKNVAELKSIVGADAENGTSVSGSIHRAWIDVKATFSGRDRKGILEECERGEDAIKKAYKTAMEETNLSADATAAITRQKQVVDAGHNEIKSLRDSQA